MAKQPIAPIPRSIAASGLLSHVLVSKFQDHLPLHRQETILRRIGVDIPRTTFQWPKILNYLKDPRLDISNNLSERAIKPFVIGRKGWLFANSVAGANAAAAIFSIIETCKYHQIEPYDYLRYVLNALPQCQAIEDYEKLLPYKIDRTLLIADVS